MNLHDAREKLFSTTIGVSKMWHRQALEFLRQSEAPEAVHLLADAEAQNQCAAECLEILGSYRRPEQVEELWRLWAESRRASLGEVLKNVGVPSEQPGLEILSALKLGLSRRLDDSRGTALAAVDCFSDQDRDVRVGAEAYLLYLQDANLETWLFLLLRLQRYQEIGHERAAMRSILPFLDDPEVSDDALGYMEALPPEQMAYFLLVRGWFAELVRRPQLVKHLAAYFNDESEDLSELVDACFAYLETEAPLLAGELVLRLQMIDDLGADSQTAGILLGLYRHRDTEVQQGLRQYYLHRPVRDPYRNLYFLLLGQYDRIHQLTSDPDDLLSLFRAATACAATPQLLELFAALHDSGDTLLVDTMLRSVQEGQGRGVFELFEVLFASGNDEELFRLSRLLKLPELLRLARRWDTSNWRPGDERQALAIDQAIAACRELGELELVPAPPPPGGLVELAEYWRRQELSEEEFETGMLASDPLVRARVLFLSPQRGLPAAYGPPSNHWICDLAINETGDSVLMNESGQNHVYWLSIRSPIDPRILAAEVGCTPAAFQAYEQMLEDMVTSGTPGADLNLRLLRVLHAFQECWQAPLPEAAGQEAEAAGQEAEPADQEAEPADQEAEAADQEA